ncbi:MAG: putative addiction module antidote protein [Rickettsiales bacterium]|jgi:probable addiction module antidote protein|nr:putative addiction module antidote protein [Rickettsiales bacterium]
MAKTKIVDWNVLDYLDNEKSIAAYLQAAVAEDNPMAVISAIGDIARARGINKMAADMGVNRESLYKSLSGKTKPQFDTIYNAIDKLGLEMRFVPKPRMALHT